MKQSILITQVKGVSQANKLQRATLKVLGVRGIGKKIVRSDTRAIRGMLNQVQHLVSAIQVKADTKASSAKKIAKGYRLEK